VVAANHSTIRDKTGDVIERKTQAAPPDRISEERPPEKPKITPVPTDNVAAKLPDPKSKPEPEPPPEAKVVLKPEPMPVPKTQPQPELKLTPEEEQVLQLVNTARSNHASKPPALKPNTVLVKIARDHAAKIAREEKLDENLDEKRLGALLRDGGYNFKASKLGANQAADNNLQPTAAFEAWYGKQVTKEILLEPNAETGIGIVKSDKGETYYLMIFATPD
jgi:uncharacterized protein YkwD